MVTLLAPIPQTAGPNMPHRRKAEKAVKGAPPIRGKASVMTASALLASMNDYPPGPLAVAFAKWLQSKPATKRKAGEFLRLMRI